MSHRVTPTFGRACRLTASLAIAGLATGVAAGANPAAAAAMITVTMHSINCNETEDSTGADEPYLLFNGQRVWGDASMNDREGEKLDLTFTSSGTAYVSLYDEDAGWFDDDDHLGTLVITEDQKGQGVQAGRFTGDDADYTLYYEVS